MTSTVKMATSFHNKLSELEARLKAENDLAKRDGFPRDLNLDGPNVARSRPCMYRAVGSQTYGKLRTLIFTTKII